MTGSPIASLFVQIGADISQLQQGLATAEKSMQTSAGAFANMANQNQAAYEAANAVQRRFYSGAEQTTQTLGKQGEVLGMTRREFSQTGSAAVFALSAIGGKAVESNAALAGLVGGAQQLGQAFLFGSGVGVAITALALGAGVLLTMLNRTTPEMKAFNDALDGMAKNDDAVRGLQQITGATKEQADAMLKAAQVSSEYARQLRKAIQDASDPEIVKQLKGAWSEVIMLAQAGLSSLGAMLLPRLSAAYAQLTETIKPNTKALTDNAAKYLENTRLTDLFKNAIIEGARENKRYGEELNKLAEAHRKTMESLAGDLAKLDIRAGVDRIKVAADTNKEIERLNESLGKRIGDIQAGLADRMKEMDYQRNEQLEQFAKDAANIEKDYAKNSRANEKDKQKSLADLSKDTAKSIKELEKQKAKDLTGVETNRVKSLAQLDLETKKNLARAKSQVERDAVMEDAKDQREVIEAEARARIKEIEDAAAERKRVILEAAEERRQEIELRAAERQSEIEAQRKEQLEQLEERKKEASERFEHEKLLAKQQAEAQIAQAKRANDEQIRQAKAREKEQIDAINARLDEEKRAIEERKLEEIEAYQAAQLEASKTHQQRIKDLQDTRTETQKLEDAIKALGGDATWGEFLGKFAKVSAVGKQAALDIRTAFSDPASITAGESMMDQVKTGIQNKQTDLGTTVRTVIGAAADGIKTAIKELGDLGGRIMTWIGDGLGSIAEAIKTKIKDAAESIMTIITGLAGLGGRIMGWIGDNLGDIVETIKTKIGDAAKSITTIISGLADLGGRVVGWIGDGIISAVTLSGKILTNITNAINQVASDIAYALAHGGAWLDVYLKFWQKGMDFVKWIADGIASAVGSITTAIVNLLLDALGIPHGDQSAPSMLMSSSNASAATGNMGGGITVNFYYSPDVSLATRDEAQNTIAPMVVEAVLDAQRRGLL